MEAQSGYVTTNDGVRLYYESTGAGKPLVLLGGLRMSIPWWQKQVPELSKQFRVIALDMRSYGRSDKPASGNRIARHAKDLYDVIEGLGLEDVTPVGWSSGASTILSYLDLFGGHKLRGVVLVDQTPKILSDEEWKLGLGNGIFTRDLIDGWGAPLREDDAAWVRNSFIPVLFAPDYVEKVSAAEKQWMEAAILQTPPQAAIELVSDHMSQDWRSMLPTIKVPTLVITGKKSVIFPYQSSVYIAEQVPGARLVICEESGHAPFYEEPETFNAAVAEFVSTAHETMG
jgi:pimeloyl-ACP methyl ester carboxylesterase